MISPLTQKIIPAYTGNYTVGRQGSTIQEITIHHVAGVVSVETLGAIWQKVGRNGSSHYGIGYEGTIANYVDEDNTAWTNSNWESNKRAVTIETSNISTGGDWLVSDASLNSLIKLVADIAKRNGLYPLVKGKSLTWHSMYSATACPGNYLLSKMDYIVEQANAINTPTPESTPEPTPSYKFNIGDKVVINGGLYVNSNADQPTGNVENKVTNITRRADGAKHPYNTTGDLGWMDESSITSYVEPTPTPTPTPTLQKGDTVKIIGEYASNAYATSAPNKRAIGWVRKIRRVYNDTNYPYEVGNDSGVTGYFKASSLEKM